MPYAYAPNGMRILGTLETIQGRAELAEVRRNEDGSLDWDYAGDTKMFWDSQRVETHDGTLHGKALFLDHEGNEWTEDQIVMRDEDEDYIKPTIIFEKPQGD